MTTALAFPETPAILRPIRTTQKSAVHKMMLALVWFAIAISAIVFTEPAPVDAVVLALMVLLPVVGLVRVPPVLYGGYAALLVIMAFTFLGATMSRDAAMSSAHTGVTLYLAGWCLLFAAFVAKNPRAHTRLILNANLFACVVAATLGIIGYFDLLPGAFKLLTRYDRATGPFKDPNVFGPFLILGLMTALHAWLHRPLYKGFGSLAVAALLSVAVLLSFSRGAWAATALAFAIYGYLYLITAPTNWARVKLAGLVIISASLLALVLAAALQSSGVARLLEQRAALTQSYDVGAEGRFGGQEKAIDLILENPLGIGAQSFTRFHHPEEVHNVYLSMFLNAGWMGGFLFAMLCVGTLLLGFRHALKATRTQPLFLIVYAALAAHILEGLLIDLDHWRHFYLLMGLAWGLMAADRREIRKARIIRDCRPILRRAVLIIPPDRRSGRIIGRVPRPLAVATLSGARLPNPPPRRRARDPRILAALR